MADWLPITVSILALLVSVTIGTLAVIDRRTTIKLGRERDLRAWIDRVKQDYVVVMTGDSYERKKGLKSLSALIDVGRMYFPNDRSNRRSAVLDPLVELHRRIEMSDLDETKAAQDWREFIAQISGRTKAFEVDTSPELIQAKQYKNP